MRYVCSPAMEEHEARWVPLASELRYTPHASPAVTDRTRLTHPPGVRTTILDGERLVIDPPTASWAFLSEPEYALYEALASTTVADLVRRRPETADGLQALVTALFRRGLLLLDGVGAVDPALFAAGHHTPETHLVELLMTERCNLACTYCLAGTAAGMPRMTEETALRAVDLAFAMEGAERLTFELSGGEPFLEFDLMRTVVTRVRELERASGRTASLTVQTNCTLLDADRVQWMVDNDVQVGISLDGSPRSHDRSRPLLGGKGSFERVVAGIDLMQRAGLGFGALVVLNRWNLDDPGVLLDFLVENGITGFKLNPVAFLGTARSTWQDIGVTPEESLAYLQDLMHRVAREGHPVVESNVRTMCEFLVSKRRSVRCLRSHCGAGDTFQAVAADGSIYPCGRSTQSPGLRLGSVADADLRSLAEPARRNLHIAEIRSRRPDTLEPCRECLYRELCQAGCSAEAYERFGTVLHRTPQCHVFHEGYPWLMRWLSFDPDALSVLSHYEYFGPEGAVLVERDLVAREAASRP